MILLLSLNKGVTRLFKFNNEFEWTQHLISWGEDEDYEFDPNEDDDDYDDNDN